MGAERPNRWIALTGISVLSIVAFIDFTIVNTILPGIQKDLNASVGELQWVINGFILMMTALLVTMGRVGDIYGRRRVFYAGVVVFTLVSLFAGLAQSPQALIACRFVQGAAGAVTVTLGAALAKDQFPESQQGRALAVFMSITGFGLAVGPLLGGLFLSTLSWRWAFFVNIPVVIAGFAIAWRTVEETPQQLAEMIDWPGLALLIPGIAAPVTFVMEGPNWGWDAPITILTGVAGIVFLAAFVAVERRATSPIIDFGLFKNRQVLGCIVMATTLGGFFALGNFLAPLYLLNVRNELPYVAGMMLLPISATVVIVPALIGGLADRFGPKNFIVAGQVFLALSALVQIYFAPASPALFVLFGFLLFGFGWGLQQATLPLAVTSALPAASAGVALGMLYTIWNIGASFGLAIGGAIFEHLDRQTLTASIARENITLAAGDQKLVSSVLSDPSQAQELLSKLAPGLDAKLMSLFKGSFMAGYSGAMSYLLVTCVIGTLLGPMIWRKTRRAST